MWSSSAQGGWLADPLRVFELVPSVVSSRLVTSGAALSIVLGMLHKNLDSL